MITIMRSWIVVAHFLAFYLVASSATKSPIPNATSGQASRTESSDSISMSTPFVWTNGSTSPESTIHSNSDSNTLPLTPSTSTTYVLTTSSTLADSIILSNTVLINHTNTLSLTSTVQVEPVMSTLKHRNTPSSTSHVIGSQPENTLVMSSFASSSQLSSITLSHPQSTSVLNVTTTTLNKSLTTSPTTVASTSGKSSNVANSQPTMNMNLSKSSTSIDLSSHSNTSALFSGPSSTNSSTDGSPKETDMQKAKEKNKNGGGSNYHLSVVAVVLLSVSSLVII